jgi:hypothetical protein
MRSPRLCGVVNWIRAETPHGSSRFRMLRRFGATHNPGSLSQERSRPARTGCRPGSDQTAQSLLSGLLAIPHTLAFRDPKYYAERRLAKVQKCRPHLDLDGIASHNRGLGIYGILQFAAKYRVGTKSHSRANPCWGLRRLALVGAKVVYYTCDTLRH